MFAKLGGNGARVKLTGNFGLNEHNIGSMGTVIGHMGKSQPLIKFDQDGKWNTGGFVVPINKLELVNGKKYFDFQYEKAVGSPEELKKRYLGAYWRTSDGHDNWASGHKHLDDGEGREYDVPFSVEFFRNRVKVHVKKSDIPYKYKYIADDIIQEIKEQVGEDLK